MTANDYQKKAHGFVTIGANCSEYALHGLVEEVGEVLGKFAKYKRRNVFSPIPKTSVFKGRRHVGLFTKPNLLKEDRKFLRGMEKEIGDVCWMLAELCTQYGLRLDRVMQRNIRKLEGRRERGTIVGEGDER